jgi:hypothetical protein
MGKVLSPVLRGRFALMDAAEGALLRAVATRAFAPDRFAGFGADFFIA